MGSGKKSMALSTSLYHPHCHVESIFHQTHQEVELPRRAYSDVESEMANQLSILPNFQAWCRLIDVPDSKGELPKLIERKIVTEELGVNEWNPANASYIRKRSSEMALPKAEVERQIMERLRNPNKAQEKPVSSAQVIGDA